ncbi:PEGA domain-containing protein [bacterium]|nr:PEGA domain-containing protein [bacterium]
MIASLHISDGPQAGHACTLRPNARVVIGRGEESDFVILDSWASRCHCAVVLGPEGLLLEDMDSRNGISVDGARVQRTVLADGGQFQIGTTVVRVSVDLQAAPPRARRRGLRVAGWLVLLAVGVVAGAALVQRLFPSGGSSKGLLGMLAGKGTISIESDPPGATVFIDNEMEGVTPLTDVKLSTGKHDLRLERKDYLDHAASIVVASGKGEPLHIALRPEAMTSVLITSKPEGAAVFIEGEYRGKTPLEIRDLAPGPHSLRVSSENFADWHEQVKLSQGANADIHAVLGRREISFYLAGLEKDPRNVSYHTEVAHLYLLDQKVDACMRHLTLAFEIASAGGDTTEEGEYSKRLVWLIAKIYFNDYFAYGDAAFVQQAQQRIDAMFFDLIARVQSTSLVISTAKATWKRAGTLDRKMEALYRAQREGPPKAVPQDASQIYKDMGVLRRKGDLEGAIALGEKAMKANPREYRVHYALGLVYLQAKRNGDAEARAKAIQSLNAALKYCTSQSAKERIRRYLGEATR